MDTDFEYLYARAERGEAEVPWDRPAPSGNLATAGLPPGAGRTALVVGCGLGRDAEYLAGLGYATTGFDRAATAVRIARERHPGTAVDYRVADLLDPPAAWRQAFDLVLESNTVQSLASPERERAIAAVAGFVAPGGTLLVLAAAASTLDGPPWPLTRAEIDAFATDGVRPAGVEEIPVPGDRLLLRWRATYTR